MSFREKLDKFDLDVVTISELERFFSNEILGHNRPTIKLWFDRLFRVRNVTSEKLENLSSTSSIWYPEWNTINQDYHTFNRCSDKGQNFFYCSNSLEATIKETNPNDNDLLLIGIFGMKHSDVPAQTQFAGIDSIKKNGHHKLLKKHIFPTEYDELLEKEISKIFREIISKSDENRYKLSIAFSNILLKNEEINCLTYPSVAANLEFENHGLKPEFVDEHMYCEQTYLYRVEKSDTEIILTAEKYGVISINRENPKVSSIKWINNNMQREKIQLKYSIQHRV